MQDLRRQAETFVDLGTFAAVMLPTVVAGLFVAALGHGVRAGAVVATRAVSLVGAALPR